VSRSHRYGDALALVLADLDDFKSVNDTHGHPVGDLVLREFGSVLRKVLREVDVREAVVGRRVEPLKVL
jgi:diguanylate cyclase (GGDEF)-like protein